MTDIEWLSGDWRESGGFRERLNSVLQEFSDEMGMQELADWGIDKMTIRIWLNGRVPPRISSMTRLSLATGISLDWLAFGDDQYKDRICKQLVEAGLRACPECDGQK